MTRTVVIGIGNAYRRDDGVGLVVVESVRDRVDEGVEVLTYEQEPSRLIEAWEGAGAVIVVDAASGPEPGTVRRFDAVEQPIPAGVFRSSTHAFGVGDAIEISRTLGTLPARLVVYGVAGEDFAAGVGLTAPVQAAVGAVAEAILRDLEEAACTSAP